MINPYGGPDYDYKVFTLPSAGSVVVWGPEMRIIRTREFQRLGGVKQLGTSYLVFRGATHTRFEHSLGTLHQAQRLVEAVNRNTENPTKIEEAAHRFARLFALLHDITHVPFGHTLEDELNLLRRHDENRGRLERLVLQSEVGDILGDVLGDDLEPLIQHLEAREEKQIADLRFPYVADLVGNTVCADLLDYMQRDLSACGMPVALGDRFLDFFTITHEGQALRPEDRRRMALALDKRRMPRPDVESEVIKLLSYRYELAERVYFHHGKNAASVMIGRAAQASGLVGDDTPLKDDKQFDWLSDETLLRSLASPAVAEALGLKREERSPERLQLAARLGQAVLNRDLYKIAYLGVRDDLQDAAEGLYELYKGSVERAALENELAGKAGLEPGQVLIHLPSPDMLLKPADVKVVTSDSRIVTLEAWDDRHSGRARALNRAHERLWRVTVYVDPNVGEDQKNLVRAAAQATFGPPSRYVQPPKLDAYVSLVFDQNEERKGWNADDRRALEETGLAARLEGGQGYEDVLAAIETRIELARARQAEQVEPKDGEPSDA